MVGQSSLTHPAENLAETADWLIELDKDNEIHDAWAADGLQPQGHQVTPKAAPSKGKTTQISGTR